MRTPQGCAAIGFSAWFFLALAACGSESDVSASGAASSERQTIRVARTNGQTGMEGSCQPVPEPRPFSADDVRALIEGTRTTTLAYRVERRLPGSSIDDAVGLPMTVEVELRGEPRMDPEVFERCNVRIDQDVEVTLSLDEPALDVVIETTASAFSSTFATAQLQVGGNVSAALGLPPGDVTTFTLAFDESGMKGTFEQVDACGRAVFPASVRCPDWSLVEVDLDSERDGFRARLLSALEELGDVPLEWGDGTQTTLAVSLAEAPEWACSGDWVETFCPERLAMPLSIRVVTADGRLDAELPAQLSVQVATEASATDASCGFARTAGEIEGLSINATYFGMAAGGPGPELIPPLEADTGFSLNVWRSPESPDQTTAEIRMYTLEQRDLGLTPPLDATTDPAGASCVAFAPSQK
jgi:hypothetical protein